MQLKNEDIKLILKEKYNVSRETLQKLETYVFLLEKWQKSINLISSNTIDDIWSRHILDSIQLINFLQKGDILDVGSGAGFPGAVIAIVTNYNVTCLDSDLRKCLFLKEVFLKTEIRASVENIRLENFTKKNKRFQTITARGFSKLVDLLNIVYCYNCEGLFLKGKLFEQEIIEAQRKWMFHVEQFNSETSNEGKILKINNVKLVR